MFKNKKGAELPMNMLVMIAIAVFVIFLILGFTTGGWGFFARMFGGTTKAQGGIDVAILNCKNACSQYASDGSPEIEETDTSNYWYRRLLADKRDLDINNDNNIDDNDEYRCRDAGFSNSEDNARALLTASECPLSKGYCGGTISCEEQTYSSCESVGCDWDGNTDTCSGSVSCSNTPKNKCATIRGCNWKIQPV